MKQMLPKGFSASGVCAGIKTPGKKDLGLLHSELPAHSAGVFTTNRIQAAPVVLDRRRIASGECRSVIVNSGNANCCTGEMGLLDAKAMARYAAAALAVPETQVLVASTGVIGEPLPMERIQAAVPELILRLSPGGLEDFSRAILTTDTVPKVATRQGTVDGVPYTVTGIAKGAGMIHPNMATLLCFVCADLGASPADLNRLLSDSVKETLNRISIDGDMSTNDTVLLLANGASGAVLKNKKSLREFRLMLDEILGTLARAIVKDGEGVTKLVEVRVEGASSRAAARRVAETIATSSLVKTAFFGEDANWGRVLAAAGRSGVRVEGDRIDVFFDATLLVKGGVGCGKAAEAKAARVLKQPEFCITIRLGEGPGRASILTSDLSVDYVKINAHYRS